MKERNELYYQNRINLLRARGEEINRNLINKCKRKLRQLQKAGA